MFSALGIGTEIKHPDYQMSLTNLTPTLLCEKLNEEGDVERKDGFDKIASRFDYSTYTFDKVTANNFVYLFHVLLHVDIMIA